MKNKLFKEGELIQRFGDYKGLWKVFGVRAESVTLIPIMESVARGAITRQYDFSRKPIIMDTTNIYYPGESK